MKKIAFTICAKNYLGLAQVLEKSIKKYNSDIDFLIFIADEFDDEIYLPQNVFISKNNLDIPHSLWNEMAFKYDLTEFCTAIKPFCFSFILSKYGSGNMCLYFDPDIAVFNSLDSIFEKLSSESILLTPHIVTIQNSYTGPLKENKLLYSGMFNLGFVGIMFDEISNDVIEWWMERLKFGCYKSQAESYFTDQKWIDFLPVLCSKGLHISFDLGNNLAPWNFYERKVIKTDSRYYVTNRLKESDVQFDLNFVHFSGYDYSLLMNGKQFQNNISSFSCPEDIKLLIVEYENLLKQSNFCEYSNFKYSYNFFSNGLIITDYHRRIYRRLVEDFQYSDNPFDINNSFYEKLYSGNLIMALGDNFIIQKENSSSNQKKIICMNYIFLFIFKIIGRNNYFNLLKLIRRYSILENQIFLFDSKFLHNSELRK